VQADEPAEPRFHPGGLIKGPDGSDSVPVLIDLSSERVFTREQVKRLDATYRILSRECATRQCQNCAGTACLHGPLGPWKPGDPCMHHCHTPQEVSSAT
jgi:hypothetical protein